MAQVQQNRSRTIATRRQKLTRRIEIAAAIAAAAALSVPAAADPFALRFSLGVAGSDIHAKQPTTLSLAVPPTDVVVSARLLGAADLIATNGALIGAEIETAFGQKIFSSGIDATAYQAGTQTTATEQARGSIRVGYQIGAIIPYLRAGAAAVREKFSLTSIVPAASSTIDKTEILPFIGGGAEWTNGPVFARIESNWFGRSFAPQPATISAPAALGGSLVSVNYYQPFSIDYEIRIAAGFTFTTP